MTEKEEDVVVLMVGGNWGKDNIGSADFYTLVVAEKFNKLLPLNGNVRLELASHTSCLIPIKNC